MTMKKEVPKTCQKKKESNIQKDQFRKHQEQRNKKKKEMINKNYEKEKGSQA